MVATTHLETSITEEVILFHRVTVVALLGAVEESRGETGEKGERESREMDMECTAANDEVRERLQLVETGWRRETRAIRATHEPDRHSVTNGVRLEGGGVTSASGYQSSIEKGKFEAEGHVRQGDHLHERLLQDVQVSRIVGLSATDTMPVMVAAAIAPQGHHRIAMRTTRGRLC